MSDSLEARVAQLEEQLRLTQRELRSEHSLLLKLSNRELALRSLACALIDQLPPDQAAPLAERVDEYVLQALDQIPPEDRDAELLHSFVHLLREQAKSGS